MDIIQSQGYRELWDVIQGIESGGYEWSDEEETKNESRLSPRRVTPPHIKDALVLLQSLNESNKVRSILIPLKD